MTVGALSSGVDRQSAGMAALPSHDVVFIDTECTGLDLDAEIWEFAAIRLRADGSRHELHIFITHNPTKAATLPEPFRTDYQTRCPQNIDKLVSQEQAVAIIVGFIGINSVVVGAKPAYDSQRLATLFSRYCRRAPSWLNSMVDVCALAAGRLWANNQQVEFPLHSERLAHQLGISANDFNRHTAMGDAIFVEAIFNKCIQPENSASTPLLNKAAA